MIVIKITVMMITVNLFTDIPRIRMIGSVRFRTGLDRCVRVIFLDDGDGKRKVPPRPLNSGEVVCLFRFMWVSRSLTCEQMFPFV